MNALYPETAPREEGMMKTGDGHEIYWARYGNRKGTPVVFLHGGPGSGCTSFQPRLFNPKKYDVIIFDQRGCGKSRPHASLKNNTTPHLVADMEQLRKYLGVEKWAVVGGSWGSTLALAYAHSHAKKILALAMWGIFLSRPAELRDLYFDGGVASRVFPDAFEKYLGMLPKADRINPIKGYRKLFLSKNRALRLKALANWTRMELRASRLIVSEEDLNSQMENPDYVLSHSLIENHYFLHDGFIDGDGVLKTIGRKLKDIPVHIVQGRYDMVCPFATAWDLHKAVKHSVLHVIDDEGHSARQPKMQAKVVGVLDDLSHVIPSERRSDTTRDLRLRGQVSRTG
jgi:proline iminopeptidase